MDDPTDRLGRRIARHLPDQPKVSPDVEARLAAARATAAQRGREARAPWWLRHMWPLVTTVALTLSGWMALWLG